jgi:hypothetical protein
MGVFKEADARELLKVKTEEDCSKYFEMIILDLND